MRPLTPGWRRNAARRPSSSISIRRVGNHPPLGGVAGPIRPIAALTSVSSDFFTSAHAFFFSSRQAVVKQRARAREFWHERVERHPHGAPPAPASGPRLHLAAMRASSAMAGLLGIFFRLLPALFDAPQDGIVLPGESRPPSFPAAARSSSRRASSRQDFWRCMAPETQEGVAASAATLGGQLHTRSSVSCTKHRPSRFTGSGDERTLAQRQLGACPTPEGGLNRRRQSPGDWIPVDRPGQTVLAHSWSCTSSPRSARLFRSSPLAAPLTRSPSPLSPKCTPAPAAPTSRSTTAECVRVHAFRRARRTAR